MAVSIPTDQQALAQATQLANQFMPLPQATPPAPQQVDLVKQNWIKSAQKVDPSVSPSQLSDIYDQYVATGKGLPEEKTSIPQQSTNQSQQSQTANPSLLDDLWKSSGLGFVASDSGQSMANGIVRGVKSMAQGVNQKRIELGEKYPWIRDTLSGIGPLGPLANTIAPQPQGATRAYTDQVNKEIAQDDAQNANNPISYGAGKIAGTLLSSMVPGTEGTGVLENMLSGGAQGALLGGMSFDPTGQNTAVRTAIGGALGGTLGGTYAGARNFIGALLSKPVMNGAAEISPQQIKNLGLEGGTVGTLSGNPQQLANEQAIIRKGGSNAQQLIDARNQLASSIYNKGQQMLDAVGGIDQGAFNNGESIENSLRGSRQSTNDAIGAMYDLLKDAPGNKTPLSTANIKSAINDVQDNYSPDVYNAFSKGLKGLIDPQTGSAVNNSKQLVSVENAINIAQTINRNLKHTSDADVKGALKRILAGVYDTVDKVADIGHPAANLFNLARTMRQEMGDIYDQKDIVNNLIKLKGSTTDQIAPENVANKIFDRSMTQTNLSKVKNALLYRVDVPEWIEEAQKVAPNMSYDDLRSIYNEQVLPSYNKGQEVWDNLRQTKMADMIRKSTVDLPTADRGNVPILSYTKLSNEVNKVGKEPLREIIGNSKISDQFYDLMQYIKNFEAKPKIEPNLNKSANIISKLAGGIFSHMGPEDSHVGGYLHLPFHGIANILQKMKDAQWVKANLAMASNLSKSVARQIEEKDPGLTQKVFQTLKNINANPTMVSRVPLAAIFSQNSGVNQ